VARACTHEEYLEKLRVLNIPFVPIEEYKNSKTKILHRCTKGHTWSVLPANIIRGYGCPECSGKKRKTTEEYKNSLVKKGIKFQVLEPYMTAHTKILHKCLEGHEWKAKPNDILNGRGCPGCAKTSFKYDKPAILYYLKINTNGSPLYKIGVTNRELTKRFPKEDYEKVTVLLEKKFSSGTEAYNQEQGILKEFHDSRINQPGLLKYNGNTELFTEDVLQLDKEAEGG
jgi:predicted  nucleic acid-binding Zn-ribbon protein